MIRVRLESGSLVLEGGLEPGVVAYIDTEWLAGDDGGDAPAMTVDGAGVFQFGGHSWEAPQGLDPDAAALLAFSSFAQDAVTVLTDPDPDVTTVTGNGIAAAEIRRALGATSAAAAPDRPRAVIDTTGNPAAIRDAAHRLAGGGVLVLAGEPSGRRTDLNLYPDVHLRGLEVVGVGPLLSRLPSSEGLDPRPGTPESPQPASIGQRLPSAAWYRVEL